MRRGLRKAHPSCTYHQGCKPFLSVLSHPLISRACPAYPSTCSPLHKLSPHASLAAPTGMGWELHVSVRQWSRLLYISSLTPFLPVKSTDLTLWGQVSSSPCQFPHLEFTYSLLPNWKALGTLTHQTSGLRQTERVKDWPQEAQKHSDSEGRKDPIQMVASAF